jgi:adenosine deaminase
MSDVSVSSETMALATTFGWGWDQLEQVAVHGARSAFAPWAERERLVHDVIRPAYAAARAGG